MTLPDERYRAMKAGKEFLYDLLDPKKTPRVPKDIRRRAYHVLRHYPDNFHFELIAERLPDWFDQKPWAERIYESKDRTV